jgi:Putative Ig domain
MSARSETRRPCDTVRHTRSIVCAVITGFLVACGHGGSGSQSPSNSAPQIAGSAPPLALVGEPYYFAPTASDPDGDTLTFSVSNLPAWASFNTANGAISGMPGQGDLGDFENVRISVSDGRANTSLAAFRISVVASAAGTATLSWDAPTEQADGSPLTDLAGFKIYWGTAPGVYLNIEKIDNPGLTLYVLTNLAPNTYYFVATAFNGAGSESDPSNVVVKTVN